jgi:hypothetical protein
MRKSLPITASDLELKFPDPPVPLHEHRRQWISWNQWMDETAARTAAYFRQAPPPEPDLSPKERFSLD